MRVGHDFKIYLGTSPKWGGTTKFCRNALYYNILILISRKSEWQNLRLCCLYDFCPIDAIQMSCSFYEMWMNKLVHSKSRRPLLVQTNGLTDFSLLFTSYPNSVVCVCCCCCCCCCCWFFKSLTQNQPKWQTPIMFNQVPRSMKLKAADWGAIAFIRCQFRRHRHWGGGIG